MVGSVFFSPMVTGVKKFLKKFDFDFFYIENYT